MRMKSKLVVALLLVAPLLDGYIEPGSNEYIACRKDRDVQHSNADARTDRRQRDLGEYMMNHPDHP